MPQEAGLVPLPPPSDQVVLTLSPGSAPVSRPVRLDGSVRREWIDVTVPTVLGNEIEVTDLAATVVTRLFEETGSLIVEWQFIGGLDRGPVEAVLRPGRYMLALHGLGHVPLSGPLTLLLMLSPS